MPAQRHPARDGERTPACPSLIHNLAVGSWLGFPPSRVTGVFGQNVAWLVGLVGRRQTFVGLGIGTEMLTLVLLLAFFERRGWF